MPEDSKAFKITDLPVHIFEKTVKPLGNDFRFTLRYVCKPFRALVDTWDPEYEEVEIGSNRKDVYLKFGDCSIRYNGDKRNQCVVTYDRAWPYNVLGVVDGDYMDVAIDDLYSILSHPKLKLSKFHTRQRDLLLNKKYSKVGVYEKFMEKLKLKLEGLKFKIHVENVHLEVKNSREDIKMLKYFQPGTLKSIRLGGLAELNNTFNIKEMIEELNEMEQVEQVEEIKIGQNLLKIDKKIEIPRLLKCSKIDLDFKKLSTKKTVQLVKDLLQLPTLNHCQISKQIDGEFNIRRSLRAFGAREDLEDRNILIYRIPESEEFFEIEILRPENHWGYQMIRVERKQKS